MARVTRAALSEENRVLNDNLLLLTERLAELELGLEDAGWTRMVADSEREFSRDGLRRIIAQSRLFFLKSPVINRGVNVQAAYVFGQGVNIEAEDDAVNETIQTFLDDPANQTELTSHQARLLKEVDLQVLGNLFFVFFTNRATGQVTVRSINVDEISDIITDPEDARSPWYYHRVWMENRFDPNMGGYGSAIRAAYYPDWRYQPSGRPASLGGVPVMWDNPVCHVKVGGLSDMRFGVPETYQSLDWARAYKEFLEDRATIARALSRFAWRLTTPGGAKGVAAAKAKLGTTISTSSSETNPPPVTGAAFVGGQGGAVLDPIRVSGATISPEEGRRYLLMAAMGMGLPETFFGDVNVGTLATAKSLDRPTELKFRDRQQLWADVLHDILQFVVEQSQRAPRGLPQGVDAHIDISFPDILERDIEARVRAIVSAATLDDKATAGTMDDRTLARLLLQALGLDDVDELLDKVAPADGDSLAAQMRNQKAAQAQAIADKQAQAAPAVNVPPRGEEQEPAVAEAMMVRAVDDLREALERLE